MPRYCWNNAKVGIKHQSINQSCFILQYLTTDYCKLCEVLEPVVSVKDKEDIATCLVHIMQKLNKAKDFLTDIIMTEVSQLGKFENHESIWRMCFDL